MWHPRKLHKIQYPVWTNRPTRLYRIQWGFIGIKWFQNQKYFPSVLPSGWALSTTYTIARLLLLRFSKNLSTFFVNKSWVLDTYMETVSSRSVLSWCWLLLHLQYSFVLKLGKKLVILTPSATLSIRVTFGRPQNWSYSLPPESNTKFSNAS